MWYNTAFDVNREVENGRGIVDYTISKGAMDKTLIEFKLASNSKLNPIYNTNYLFTQKQMIQINIYL